MLRRETAFLIVASPRVLEPEELCLFCDRFPTSSHNNQSALVVSCYWRQSILQNDQSAFSGLLEAIYLTE